MWDERYAEAEFAYGTEPNDFLRECLPALTLNAGPRRALCVAEGQGRNAVWLAEAGWEVLAVDQSAVGLERARQLASSRAVHIETVVADLADFDPGEARFELVVSIWAHFPPELRRRVHAALVRALVPGGWLVLEAYAPANVGRGVGGPQDPSLCMRPEELELELAGLRFERASSLERMVHEGHYHRGMSAVTQVLARRP